MAAIQALQTAVSALRRNPVLFLGGLVIGLVTLPQIVTQLMQIPLVPTGLSALTFFVTPFLVAGLVGMADEALTGETQLGTVTDVGRDRYVPLLLGNLVQFAIGFAFAIVIAIVALGTVLSLGVSAGAGMNPGAVAPGTIAVVGVVVLLVVLAYLLVLFFVQFFAVAIVVDEEGPISGFTASYRLVRRNLLSTLGYSVVNFAVAVATSLPVTGFVLLRTFQNLDAAGQGVGQPSATAAATGLPVTEAVAVGLISLALSTLLTTFQQTYAVAFYRRHEDAGERSDIATGIGEFDDVAY
jgi:hypothetical protein